MAKSRRILSALLSVLMVLTMLPIGLMSTAGAVSNGTSTTSIDADQGFLDMPNITISATSIIRTAAAADSQANGTTIVKATPSGLPEISGSYASAYYAGETPVNPMVVFTTDKALVANPTITCSNATVSFTAVQTGDYVDGSYNYSWIVSGTNVSVKQLDFVVGYTYEYVNANGKTVNKTYAAYTTSAVENISQPGGIEPNRKRAWHITEHFCDRKENAHYIFRVLGANTFGTYADTANVGYKRGYFDFNSSSFVEVSNAAASGYAQVYCYDDDDSDGTHTFNKSVDKNRPVSVTYIDRSIVNLEKYNLRVSVHDLVRRTDKYSDYQMEEFRVLAGNVEWTKDTPTNPTSTTELGITASAPIASTAGGTVTIPMSGSLYSNSGFTDMANGNKTKSYTFIVSFGAKYDGITRARSSVSLQLVTYDKSELRAELDDLYRAYAPTQILAADSEIGNNPNSWFYSAGWDQYLAALKNAEYVLNDPDTDQNTIDAAVASLKSAVAGLQVATADYTEANIVIDEVKNLTSAYYTDESWSRVQTAVSNVISGISIFCQAYLDSLVADLREAIANLEMYPANYEDVDLVVEIYENLNPDEWTAESFTALRDTVMNVDYSLKIDKQALVDAYAKNIDAAINNLVPAPANYDEVNALVEEYNKVLPNKDNYTDLTWRSVNAAYNSIDYNKTWKQQSDVDNMAINLQRALNNLKLKTASYDELGNAIDEAYDYIESRYTTDSWSAFEAALEAAEDAYVLYEKGQGLDITRQSEVDAIKNDLIEAQNNLEPLGGDYTKVEKAIETADNLEETDYTPESWKALQDAIEAVDYDLNADEQDIIDGYADAINDAIKNLKGYSADYTEVNAIIKEWQDMDKSIYTAASILKVTTEINAIDWTLSAAQQKIVDGYVTKIRAAIDALEYLPADYSAVNTAMTKAEAAKSTQETFAKAHNGYSYYTPASYNALVAAMTYETGLDIRYQTTVDGYAAALNTAYNGLTPNDGDYSEVDKALASIPADLEDEVYIDELAAEVIVAQLAVVRGLNTTQQSTIDKYAADINTAVKNLKYKSADYTNVELAISLIPEDLSIYTAESVKDLQDAVDSVDYNLDINHQDEVEAFAELIIDKIGCLELDNTEADYSKVTAAITAANEAIKDTNYTDASIQAVKDAINAVVYKLNKSEQARVDGFATAIDNAVKNLTDKPLDLTSYNAAIAKVPTDLNNYTADSVANYQSARTAADNYKAANNSIRNQTAFEALVTELDSAIDALVPNTADYSAVLAAKKIADAKRNAGIYTQTSIDAYDELIVSINWTLTYDKQTTVDGYAAAISSFVFVEISASYDALDAAISDKNTEIAKNLYTDASVAEFNALVATFDRTLGISKQSTVDGYTAQVEAFVLTYKSADYTALDALVDEVNALDSSLYENYDEIYADYFFDYIFSVIPSHRDYNITEQDKVDEMTSTLQSYVDMLVLKETKVAKFELKNGAAFKNTKYIVGLTTGITVTTLKSRYFEMENVSVTITKASTGRNVGTGSVVTVTNDLTGEKMAEYTIIIYGDINGDGVINANDTTAISNMMSGTVMTAAQRMAANINGDRNVNALDYNALCNVLQGYAAIDQTTGRAK